MEKLGPAPTSDDLHATALAGMTRRLARDGSKASTLDLKSACAPCTVTAWRWRDITT
jgi:hypothetical protein